MCWNARNASHTTYALRDTPSQIRITNPIHPLRERTLEVVIPDVRAGRRTGSCACPTALAHRFHLPGPTIPEALFPRSASGPAVAPRQKACAISSGCWAVWSIQPRIRRLVHVWLPQETHMSKQLLLFDPRIPAWVRELWNRIDAQKRREILRILANMGRASLTASPAIKTKETDNESECYC